MVRESEILPSDRKNQRLWRSGYLAQLASENNLKVLWWTKSFDHYNKKQRKSGTQIYKDITINIIKGIGYKENLSITRLLSEFLWSFSFFYKALFTIKKNDIIFCSMPTITSSFACALISRISGASLILDFRDQWPEIFKNTSLGKKFIGKIFIIFLEKLLVYAAMQASKIYSVNENYGDWLSRIAQKNIEIEFAPMAYPVDLSYKIKDNKSVFYKNEDSIKLLFAGSLNDMMDLDWILGLLHGLNNFDVELIIAGDGLKRKEWEDVLHSCNFEIDFIGHLDSINLSHLMRDAEIGLAPYKEIENFLGHVPNKIPEYLAHDLKIIGTLNGHYYTNLEKLNFYKNFTNIENICLEEFIKHKNTSYEKKELFNIIDLKTNYMKIIDNFKSSTL